MNEPIESSEGRWRCCPQITQIDADCKPMKDERTYRIIGCAMEVHRELGCGFLEAVYQEALEMEFKAQQIPFEAQPVIRIYYKRQVMDLSLIHI